MKKLGDGDLGTRIVEDACIFLNRPGFPAGAGCALHLAALGRERATSSSNRRCAGSCRSGARTTSPDGRVTSVVRQWDRRHWGKGGEDFHWWCTEDPAAFVGRDPVYVEMQRELETMAGRKVYKLLAGYLDGRRARDGSVTPLPHPTVRH